MHGRLAPVVVELPREGAAARARTWDNHVTAAVRWTLNDPNSVVLYQLSYGGASR